jgi:hypothetical protein
MVRKIQVNNVFSYAERRPGGARVGFSRPVL